MSISVDDITILDALTSMDADAAHSRTPTAYIHAIRTGTPGSRHHITINGIPAHITITTPAEHSPRRIAESFTKLREAMKDAALDGIQPQLPPEISMVTWRHNGHELRLCAPGAAPTLRRARQRIRRRLTALSPLPLLTALIQPLAGSATAVGIAVAPVLPVPAPPPAPAVATPSTGDITRPQPPYTLADLLNTPPTLPTPALDLPPAEATAPDTTTPPPAVPLPTPSPSATPTPTISPTATASPGTIPSPTPTPEQTTTVPQPIRTILDTLTGAPTAEPSPTPQTSATSGPPRHGKHKGHRHRQGHGHGKYKGHWSRWLR